MNPQITLVRSFEEAQAFIEWADRPHDKVAIDTETSGFDHTAQVRTVQLGDRDDAWVIPMDRVGYGGLVLDALSRMRNTRFLMHNFTFDTTMLERAGVKVPFDRVEDTRIKAFCVEPWLPSGLKPVADRVVGPYASEGEKELAALFRKNHWDWDTVPIDTPQYWWYGGLDCVLTCLIDDHYDGTVRARHQAIYDLEYAAQVVVRRIVNNGVRVDVEYCVNKAKDLLAEADEMRRAARWYWGIENLGSSSQVADLLVRLGYDPDVGEDRWTKGGKVSTSRHIMEVEARGNTPWAAVAEATVRLKHLEKMAGPQYLGGFPRMADGDGFLHPSINPIGARTARMSVSTPALQTLHRDDPTVRDAFLAREGHVMIFADYDQMEVRLCAHICGDPAFQALVRDSDDVHKSIASQVYGVPVEDVTKAMRQRTKNVIYSKLYGAGVDKFAQTAGITTDEARAFLSAFDAAVPGVRALQDEVSRVALERYVNEGVAYVTTGFGRTHPLAPYEVRGTYTDYKTGELKLDGEDYKLMNYLIQGWGADELKRALVDADRAGIGDYLALLVHDEIGADVPIDEADEVERVLVDCMENHTYDVPLTVDPVRVARWGDKVRMKT